MSELPLLLFTSVLAVSTTIAAVTYAVWLRRRLETTRQELRDAESTLMSQLALVRQSISGLTAGAVGMDRRMARLENREKALTERQETYENQQLDEQPYSHAIRLVQQGASQGRLIDELGLGEGEAELIVRLHGHRDSA